MNLTPPRSADLNESTVVVVRVVCAHTFLAAAARSHSSVYNRPSADREGERGRARSALDFAAHSDFRLPSLSIASFRVQPPIFLCLAIDAASTLSLASAHPSTPLTYEDGDDTLVQIIHRFICRARPAINHAACIEVASSGAQTERGPSFPSR